MAKISKKLGVISDTAERINLAISTKAMLGMSAMMTFVSTQMALADENANIRGALETNQAALEAVQESSFTAEGAQETSQSALNTFLYVVGAIGVILVGLGIWNLWNHFSEGEQARGKASTGILLCVIGGLFTIPAIITGVPTILLVGDGA